MTNTVVGHENLPAAVEAVMHCMENRVEHGARHQWGYHDDSHYSCALSRAVAEKLTRATRMIGLIGIARATLGMTTAAPVPDARLLALLVALVAIAGFTAIRRRRRD